MHFTLALLLTVLTFVTAIPTPALLPRGECSTIGPYLLQQLNSSKPYDYSVNSMTTTSTTNNGNDFAIIQDNVNACRSVQLVAFKIPPGSHTCTLYISDTQSTINYTQPASPPLNIISLVANSITAGANYASVFNTKSDLKIDSNTWSSVTLHAGDTPRVLNSRACPEPASDGSYGTLPFVFEFQGGEEKWGNGAQGAMRVKGGREESFSLGQTAVSSLVMGKAAGMNGVYMTYNC